MMMYFYCDLCTAFDEDIWFIMSLCLNIGQCLLIWHCYGITMGSSMNVMSQSINKHHCRKYEIFSLEFGNSVLFSIVNEFKWQCLWRIWLCLNFNWLDTDTSHHSLGMQR